MGSNYKVAIVDTGALVAFLSSNDTHHLWAVGAFKKLPAVLITCEAVISETCFLLQRNKQAAKIIGTLLRQEILRVVSLTEEVNEIFALMEKYSNIPMSYADASLVRLAELEKRSVIVSIDRDFTLYRSKNGQRLALVAPS